LFALNLAIMVAFGKRKFISRSKRNEMEIWD